ncbi:MAG: histidine kinase [Flavobacteriales bacterium]|nr:histidine kinase [Flavobacteriales bacterium]
MAFCWAQPQSALQVATTDTSAMANAFRAAQNLLVSAPDSAILILQTQWSNIPSDARQLVGLSYFLARAEARFTAVDMIACMQECDSAMRYRRDDHEEDEAAINVWKARIFTSIGDYAIAYRLIEGALGVYSTLGDVRRMAECNNELGWVHYVQEQYALAERRWGAMLAQSRVIPDLRLEAVALRRVGPACLYLYDPDDIGHAYYDSALVASRMLGDPQELARIHSNIGNMDSALFYARVSGDEALLHTIMHTAGIIGMKEGDPGPGLKYCGQALRFARRVGHRMLERDAAACLCDAFKLAGRWKEAFEAMEEWRGVNDRMISSRSRDEIAMRAVGRDFEARAREDSIAHSAELLRLESAMTIEQLRADRNRNRALALGVGGLLLLGAVAVVYRIDRKRRRERFERDAARLQTQVLRTQMNPHFIFNALNSINNYVQENERDLASGFLTKFARLMRLVLENSRHNEVPLVQDMEALRLYMDMERARLNNRFQYAIEIDPEIDQENIMVPPLVLQPFVENAIWHGLSRKEGEGHLLLTVKQEGGMLVMAIEDDGVGRNADEIPFLPTRHRRIHLAQA